MRYNIAAVVVLALAGCDPVVPDSNFGVGFDSYSSYEQQRAAREARLRGQANPPSGVISDETRPTPADKTRPAVVAETRPAPAAEARPAPVGQPLTAMSQPAQPAATRQPRQAAQQTPTNSNNIGISDEQDFGAVSSRESIESDRERLDRQRSEYVVIAPTDVPTGGSGRSATVVNFALSTTNRVGDALYSRSKIFAKSRYNRNCQKYPSPDMAQAAFLQSGGPKRDRKGLDPDGDGFACSWDPQPFRNAISGG